MKRVHAGNQTCKLIDVSHWEKNIDWLQVKGAGYKAAYLKATDGTGYVDPTYQSHRKNALAQGLYVGAYHFFHSKMDPIDQAVHFAHTIGNVPSGDLPPVLDIEWADKMNILGEDGAHKALLCLDRVANLTGMTPIIYTAASFFQGMKDPSHFKKFPLWVANYGVEAPMVPAPWDNWLIWQPSENTPVPGAGKIDSDIFNGPLTMLQGMRKK